MSESTNNMTILGLALSEEVHALLKSICSNCEFKLITNEEQFEEEFDDFDDSHFAVVVCSTQMGNSFAYEAAQILRNQCPRTPSFFITFNRESYEPKILEKNGYSDTFLLPLDKDMVSKALIECLSPEALSARSFRSVKVMDLKPDTSLSFDTFVFLPLNQKYVKLSNKDQSLSEKKFQKLQDQNANDLFIEQKDMGAFYDYTAENLKDLAQGTGPLSETEREEKLQGAVRGLFNDIFDKSTKSDFETGKEMLSNCQNIVSTYITGDSGSNWYNQLIHTIGGSGGGYSHSSNVSTYAAMFAMGLGHEAPEDLAMSGFLHDISLADFPEEYLNKPDSEWPEDLLKKYHQHPLDSVNLVKSRKMILTENVEKAILQHHEMFSGKGFPKAMPGMKISEDAQILSFADQFDELTTKSIGNKAFTPTEACDEIEKNGSISPVLLRRIKKLLINPQ
ncbi:MAG: HD domain-containing protein [Bdellovibrionaceae bacterium]|jgi:response regulator RpfG family c-di-GMP phosphodiesterase|nr:HD domain-containing protein [Pseudobdellovibrionaceae bacterium]